MQRARDWCNGSPDRLGAFVRGLRLQLALFYVALSIPALLVIERAHIAFEFARCLAQLDDGRVQRVIQAQAGELGAAMARGASEGEIELRLERFVLQLERPRESLGTKAAYVLLELADHPFHASVMQGRKVRASAGVAIAPDAANVQRHWSAPIDASSPRSGAGAADRPRLTLDLSVPSPWRSFAERPSFEWPIALAYLVVFLSGSAWFLRSRVLIRIGRVSEAARAWAQGNFASSVADEGKDELGLLARDLDRMAADLKALVNARARLATLEERRRLARELHDTVKQKVFALSLQLGAARESEGESERVQQRVLEAIALVEEIQRELSDQLRELSDAAGVSEDLVPALEQRIADFSRRSGCKVKYGLPESLNLRPGVTETALRIVDEALANVLRHAAASEVEVLVAQSNHTIELTITDNGRGGSHDSPTGMGLANMRYRAATLPGGNIELSHPAFGGTRVHLCFDAPSAMDSRLTSVPLPQ